MKGFIEKDEVRRKRVEAEIPFNLVCSDEEIFSKLYDEFSPALYGLIIKWVTDKELAETILENAFINAWKSRKTYDSKRERIFTWLYRISHNTTTHYLEHKN